MMNEETVYKVQNVFRPRSRLAFPLKFGDAYRAKTLFLPSSRPVHGLAVARNLPGMGILEFSLALNPLNHNRGDDDYSQRHLLIIAAIVQEI